MAVRASRREPTSRPTVRDTITTTVTANRNVASMSRLTGVLPRVRNGSENHGMAWPPARGMPHGIRVDSLGLVLARRGIFPLHKRTPGAGPGPEAGERSREAVEGQPATHQKRWRQDAIIIGDVTRAPIPPAPLHPSRGRPDARRDP